MQTSRIFTHRTKLPFSPEEVYNYHARPGALQRLLPPWQKVTVLESSGSIEVGSRVKLQLHLGPFARPFTAVHTVDHFASQFQDRQEHGPFAKWIHTHDFAAHSGGCLLTDTVEWAIPGQRFIPAMLLNKIEQQLRRTFAFRGQRLLDDLTIHERYSTTPLRILISGSTGVLGSQLVPLLTTGGHRVYRLVRRKPVAFCDEIYWDPARGIMGDLPQIDAVIHLAGEYIGLNRWSEHSKHRVKESRIKGTELLCKSLAAQSCPPKTLLSASAVGYYGDCGDEVIGENRRAGDDFMAEVCQVWEQATQPARLAGIRTVTMRLGVGLSPKGGALQRILEASRIGCIRQCGDGKQFVSWIAMDDMAGAILHLLTQPDIEGAVNVSAPTPVTNRTFLTTIARVAGRPRLFGIPASLLRLVYGQMAQEILLSGCRTDCTKLAHSGYHFQQADLAESLNFMLGRKNPDR